MKGKKNIRKYIITGAVFWGAVLAFFGVLHGNQTVAPELYEHEKAVLADPARVELLNCDSYQKRTGFQLVEFSNNNKCLADGAGFSNYSCYDLSNLNDAKWVREQFRRINQEIVTFSSNRDSSIFAAAMLHHYGYNVKLLENASSIDFVALNQPEQEKVQEVVTSVSTEEGEEAEETASIAEVTEIEALPAPAEEGEDEELWEEEGC